MERFRRGETQGAHRHHGHRGGHRRAECEPHAHRKCRALRPRAAPSAPRPHRARRAQELLHPACTARRWRTRRWKNCARWNARPTASRSPRRICGCAARATCSARRKAACRRFQARRHSAGRRTDEARAQLRVPALRARPAASNARRTRATAKSEPRGAGAGELSSQKSELVRAARRAARGGSVAQSFAGSAISLPLVSKFGLFRALRFEIGTSAHAT